MRGLSTRANNKDKTCLKMQSVTTNPWAYASTHLGIRSIRTGKRGSITPRPQPRGTTTGREGTQQTRPSKGGLGGFGLIHWGRLLRGSKEETRLLWAAGLRRGGGGRWSVHWCVGVQRKTTWVDRPWQDQKVHKAKVYEVFERVRGW